ncbi:helix-turn-helix domain-containing protein [Ningiella sp. W23]|uniref:helix-turn-helix domain-containing protein n=1 Tax=Ningiella sp. W23 TaxID=3023715 RepID=UPI003756AD2C
MLLQILVPNKKAEHILFAMFCGSIAMVSLKYFSADSLGAYRYVLGLLTCGTCNVMWLISRALFRDVDEHGKPPIAARHIILAIAIALLVMANQSLLFLNEISDSPSATFLRVDNSLGEITNLLSSTILLLSFWEAIRGFHSQSSREKLYRIVFASTFALAVVACSVIARGLLPSESFTAVFPWIMSASAISIMLVVQWILYQRGKTIETNIAVFLKKEQRAERCAEPKLINEIERLMQVERIYLKADLKMLDFSNALGVPEYKVSRIIRHHFNAPNFNFFINQRRIEHAKDLMQSPDSAKWTLLVIALESGFASVGTFNRAFKSMEDCMPSEFKQRALLVNNCVSQ